MIASLPMYDRPENAAAHDRLWKKIRDNLRDCGISAPDGLDRTTLYRDTWARADLVIGQICVMPYRTSFAHNVTLIGASDYAIYGCDPGYFCSHLVCAADDPRGSLLEFANAPFVANAKHSYSGFQAPTDLAKSQGITLQEPLITGSHDNSVRAIANGTAAFAAIDAQTWRMQLRDPELPETGKLRIFERTAQAPGQSFITRQSDDPAPFFQSIEAAIADLDANDKADLSLQGIIDLPASAYA